MTTTNNLPTGTELPDGTVAQQFKNVKVTIDGTTTILTVGRETERNSNEARTAREVLNGTEVVGTLGQQSRNGNKNYAAITTDGQTILKTGSRLAALKALLAN